MALKGTLKDFGVAEIFQLIGNQAKSGVLHLKGREGEIHIFFADGNVVRAESAGRKAREKIGQMVVRAGLLNEEMLSVALEHQGRTLRRLGDILVELGMISQEDLREMAVLQTTETVYRLFHWKSGTYEFEPGAVEWDKETVTPIRSESVLMEGFRQVDEWPLIHKKITSGGLAFERIKELAPPSQAPAPKAPDDDQGLDAAFGALEGGAPVEERQYAGEFATLGKNERRVYALATEGQTVERIIDLARLGEFETCKALLNLVNLGFLEAVSPSRRAPAIDVGAFARDWKGAVGRALARGATTLVLAAAVAGLAYVVGEHGVVWADPGGHAFRGNGAQRLAGGYAAARLSGALEVYRLERGGYPESLVELVAEGLVTRRDLSYPWPEAYYYRRAPEGGYVLLPPVR